ncbi:hypothetical protein [Halomarina oriensis]|uniref:Uncharacterized protein n=1 Tax=Halomarina oriensis TaxID=671145 RepID=A0A6B0GGW3_9EURY|nr:hypothetical protein [Halomarina oriensis]MWG34112.1 hypothetical protein [Halomarina oriensis]
MTVERAAAYWILGWGAVGTFLLALVAFFSAPTAGLFLFTGLVVVGFAYYYRNYW